MDIFLHLASFVSVITVKNKIKKYGYVITLSTVMGLWFFYILWASRIGRQTVLMASIPEWMTYITAGSIAGLILAARVTYYRPTGKTPIYILESFGVGFTLGFVCSLHIYDVFVYLSPGEIIQYKSEYEVVFPGPAIGKSSRCEAGLWIKDLHTKRWIQLCTNKSALYNQRKQGMDAVWVTAHTNKIGSYIIEYQFIFK